MANLELKFFSKVRQAGIKKRDLFRDNLNKQSSFIDSEDVGLVELSNKSAALVSSSRGKIKTIVFHYPQLRKIKNAGKLELLEIIQALASKMEGVHFIIITDQDLDENETSLELDLAKISLTHTCEIISTNNESYSVWASDVYKAIYYAKDATKTYQHALVSPLSTIYRTGRDDSHIWTSMQAKVGHNCKLDEYDFVKSSSLKFDGGNILVGDDFILIGEDIRQENSHLDAKAVFESSFGAGRDVYFIGGGRPDNFKSNPTTSDGLRNINATREIRGTHQPMYHLDLFITLGGLGADGRYQLIVGQPVIGLSPDILFGLDYDVLGVIYEQLYKLEFSISKSISALEKIKNKEGKAKFRIIRIPMPLTYFNEITPLNEVTRKWYWLSYNNSIVEITKHKKKIWLPSYLSHSSEDLEPFEIEVQQILENELGFDEVHFIQADFHSFARNEGSLACVVNCIERSIEHDITQGHV